MNWNNTQFDGKYPITISCARRVGEIMKYLTPEQVELINNQYKQYSLNHSSHFLNKT